MVCENTDTVGGITHENLARPLELLSINCQSGIASASGPCANAIGCFQPGAPDTCSAKQRDARCCQQSKAIQRRCRDSGAEAGTYKRPFAQSSFVSLRRFLAALSRVVLQLGKKVANSEEILLSYTVSILANTGEVTAYSRYDRGASNLPYAKRISYDDARKQAESFLSKYNSGKAEQTRLYTRDMPTPKTPLNSDINYSFRFVRVVDGVLFPDNSVDIIVNGAGTVVGYSLMWNDVTFEKPAKAISQEEAEKEMHAQAQASLSYLMAWEKEEWIATTRSWLIKTRSRFTSMLRLVRP